MTLIIIYAIIVLLALSYTIGTVAANIVTAYKEKQKAKRLQSVLDYKLNHNR